MTIKTGGRLIELEIESWSDDGTTIRWAQYLDGEQEMLNEEALAELQEAYQGEIDAEAYEHMCNRISDYEDYRNDR